MNWLNLISGRNIRIDSMRMIREEIFLNGQVYHHYTSRRALLRTNYAAELKSFQVMIEMK